MCFLSINAQDLIITLTGDSIHCEITQTTNDHIRFIEFRNNRPEGRILKQTNIAEVFYNYSSVDILEEEDNNHDLTKEKPDIPGVWRTSISTGYSYQLGRIDEDQGPVVSNQFRDLRHGYNITLDFYRLGSSFGGAGIKTAMFRSRYFFDSGKPGLITTILYAGPSAIGYFKFDQMDRNRLFFDVSLGLLYVRQHRAGKPEHYAFGNTIGGQLALGYDIQLLESLNLFFKASLFIGSVKTITIVNSKPSFYVHRNWEDRYSLSRIDCSIGINF